MGGGGNSVLDDIGTGITHGVQSVGNWFGFDNNGQWTNSQGVFHALSEFWGGVTGANQSRAALNLARDQFNAAQTQAQDLVNQQRWNQQVSDVSASQTAGAMRSAPMGGANYSNSTPLAFGPGPGSGAPKDFLGL